MNPTKKNDSPAASEVLALDWIDETDVNYELFTAWMDAELEKLVARWCHLAAPNAGRASRSRGVLP